ncbi:MAG: NADH-quinone oxidoreductase subunit I [Elusimicrobia bacterium]|nr:NADH-quinone oxidoreductase subunit I [Elusimicrobiota bacterium]
MVTYFKEIATAAINTFKGLGVTLRYLFKPAVTVQYPAEKLVPFERFRGALLFDAETCIACNLCVKACPSSCIALENATNEAKKKIAKVAWYSIDFGKCNFCRLCEEACPTKPKAVWHSLDYELVFENRDEMVRLWKKNFDFVGMFFDRKSKEYKKPAGQIPIQTVAARR